MELYIIIILSILSILSIFANMNLLNKVEKYEEVQISDITYVEDMEKYIIDLKARLEACVKKLKDIDHMGAFESDDEVGIIFKEIKSIIESINTLYN